MKKLMTNLINKGIENSSKLKVAAITMVLSLGMSVPAFAAPNVGESASTWILTQLSYLVIIAIIIAGIKMYSSGNTVKLIITVLLGSFVLFIIKNPSMLETFGNWTAEVFGIR